MVIGFDASRAFHVQRTGTENYSHELLKALLAIDQNNSYHVYLRNGLGIDDPILKNSHVTTKNISQHRLWTQAGLAKEVFLHQPNILFVPAHTLPVLHRSSLKSVVTIHDLGAEYLPQYHQFPQKLYLNRATEYAAKHATHLIAVSEATKQDLIKRLSANPGKITVIPEAYDNHLYKQVTQAEVERVKKKYDLPAHYFFFVGTIQPRKNLVRVIEAFSRLVNEDAGKMRETGMIQLILAGKKGWLSEQIYTAPEKFGVTDCVRFLDYVSTEDLPGLYAGSTAFVYPSLFEGFGLPVLEAMACGAPVIASMVSSLPEVCGDAGILVAPENVDALTQAMQQLLTDQSARQNLIAAGFEQVKKFSWYSTAKQTLDVFEKVAGNQT